MEKLLSVHEKKKATKHSKPKKKPVKVVYISNPMKINTSASEFRALVQELTGRRSVTPESSKYLEIHGGGGGGGGIREGGQTVADEMKFADDQGLEVSVMEADSGPLERSDLTFEPYDDIFMALENFSSGFCPSNLCEAPHVDVIPSLDEV